MKPASAKRWTFMSLLALVLLTPGWATAQVTFGRIVVFGTSLSDPGNAFALTGQSTTPPYDTLDLFLISRASYARGGHHFSNGTTWIEQFSRGIGRAENTRPAFRRSSTEATNYAVGGARARDDGINVNLSDQVRAFLDDVGGVAPSDGLYVMEMGANDVRDALAAFTTGTEGGAIIATALAAIGKSILDLSAAGAREFLVLNVPNLRLTPAIRTLDHLSPGAGRLAEGLTQLFNAGLDTLLRSVAGLPGVEIARMDVYQKVNALVANPQAFGLSEVEAACVTPKLPPFACRTPDKFLFWDGVHPTKAAHAMFALEAALVLAE